MPLNAAGSAAAQAICQTRYFISECLPPSNVSGYPILIFPNHYKFWLISMELIIIFTVCIISD